MEQSICPIDVISVCAADGSIRPLRFRMENGNDGFTRVDISRVINCRQIQYVGIEAYVFCARHGWRRKDSFWNCGIPYAVTPGAC